MRPASCGLLPALSVTLSEAVRVPVPVGEKFTLILHCAPGASEPGQLLVCAKSVAFVPLIAMLLIVSVLLPVFFSCMRSEEHTSELQSLRHLVCRLLLETKNPIPVPTSLTVCGG